MSRLFIEKKRKEAFERVTLDSMFYFILFSINGHKRHKKEVIAIFSEARRVSKKNIS